MLLLITEVPVSLLGPNTTLTGMHEAQMREMEAKWKHPLTEFDPVIPVNLNAMTTVRLLLTSNSILPHLGNFAVKIFPIAQGRGLSCISPSQATGVQHATLSSLKNLTEGLWEYALSRKWNKQHIFLPKPIRSCERCEEPDSLLH